MCCPSCGRREGELIHLRTLYCPVCFLQSSSAKIICGRLKHHHIGMNSTCVVPTEINHTLQQQMLKVFVLQTDINARHYYCYVIKTGVLLSGVFLVFIRS